MKKVLRHYPPLIVFAHVYYCLFVLLRVTVLMSLLYYHVIMHFLETLTSEPVWWVIAPAVTGLRAALARCQHRRAPGLWRRSRCGESRHRRSDDATLFDLRLDRRFAGLTPGPEVSLVSIIACRNLIGLKACFMTYWCHSLIMLMSSNQYLNRLRGKSHHLCCLSFGLHTRVCLVTLSRIES